MRSSFKLHHIYFSLSLYGITKFATNIKISGISHNFPLAKWVFLFAFSITLVIRFEKMEERIVEDVAGYFRAHFLH